MRIRVLHIITGLSNGGAETMLYKLLSGIDQRRFEIAVISLTDRGVMADRIEALGIPVLTCNMPSGYFTLSGFMRLLDHIRRPMPHLVQTWLYHSDLVGGVAAKMTGVRHILWNIRHSNLDRDKNKRHTLLAVRLNVWLSRWLPDRIICNSTNSAAIHQSIGFDSNRFIIIPNGFDTESFHPDSESRISVRKELGVSLDAPLVGLVARFDSQKNHQGFVNAAAWVHEQNPSAYFVLVGSGADWANEALINWITDKSLQGHFRLLGRRDDIPRLTAALDVAVCASWGEGFPNVVGEAMACGVPCVVTNVGDCAEIVGDTGWAVPPGDMIALADRISTALTMSAEARQAQGLAARARIVERYALADIVRRYEALYLAVVNGETG